MKPGPIKPKASRIVWVAAVALLTMALTSCAKGGNKGSSGDGSGSAGDSKTAASAPIKPASVEIAAESGGDVAIKDAASVKIPAGALSSTTTVKVSSADEASLPGQLGGAQPVGRAVTVDLGGTTLSKPATLEVAFDPASLPPGTPKEAVFLAYHDPIKQTWIPVGGQVDVQRNVVSVQTERFSSWRPLAWNWAAWIAVMRGALSAQVSDFVKGIAALTEPCQETVQSVTADSAGGNNIIKACVTSADAAKADVRVLNLKSFPIAVAQGAGNAPVRLGSGESHRFALNMNDTPPVTVTAQFTQPVMNEFAVSLVARMLPAGDLLKGEGISFIAGNLGTTWDLKEVSDAMATGKAGEAATKFVQAMGQDAFVERFVELATRYGQERGIPMLTKWTAAGVKQALIGIAAVDVLVQAFDFGSNYFFNNTSKVTFQWTKACPAAEPGDFARLPNGGMQVFVVDGAVREIWVYPPERTQETRAYAKREVGAACTQEISRRLGFRIAPEPVTRAPVPSSSGSTGQTGNIRIVRRECSSDCVLWEYGQVLRVEAARNRVNGDTGRPSPASAGMIYVAVEMTVRNVSDSSRGQPHRRLAYRFVAEDQNGKRHETIYYTLTLGRAWYGRDFELTGIGQSAKTVAMFELPANTRAIKLLFESVSDNERVSGSLSATIPSTISDILPQK